MTIDIVIPVLNEERYLRRCLESVLSFEKPPGLNWRIYILDGGSQDRTWEIALEFAARNPEVEVLANPGRIQSCGLNVAIKRGQGDYVLRLDAHAFYPSNYLVLCLETSVRTQADNAGGVIITHPGGNSYGARLVQAITTHQFGVGNAGYRLDALEGPADTVPFGFFKKDVFRRLGYFDERLVRDQDYELNRRIRASGGTIWLNPAIKVHYHNQSTLKAFLKKQFFKEGPYNAYLWYLAPYAVSARHGITGAFALGVCGGAMLSWLTPFISIPFAIVLALYLMMGFVAGVQQAVRFSEWRHVLAVPIGLFLFHICHGLGFLSGVICLLFGTAPVQRIKEPWPGAGRFRAWPFTQAEVPITMIQTHFYSQYIKRWFDCLLSLVGVFLVAAPMIAIAVCIRIVDGSPVLFRQERIGRHGRLFTIFKYRTMTQSRVAGSTITVAGDARVTTLGKWLRRFKLDELPQLFNVLKGEMSFVGPRPDVSGYMDRLNGEAVRLLELRPGITGPASLAFRNEDVLLAQATDPVEFNDRVLFPEKVRLNLEYMKRISFVSDVGYILKTVLLGREAPVSHFAHRNHRA